MKIANSRTNVKMTGVEVLKYFSRSSSGVILPETRVIGTTLGLDDIFPNRGGPENAFRPPGSEFSRISSPFLEVQVVRMI
jgi:hypothetical protein